MLAHMTFACAQTACANGHAECVKVLIEHGARHVPNSSGNLPLRTSRSWVLCANIGSLLLLTDVCACLRCVPTDWAVQNRHLSCVKVLLEGIPDIDVLAQNGFGRGSVTEAFQTDDPEIRASSVRPRGSLYDHRQWCAYSSWSRALSQCVRVSGHVVSALLEHKSAAEERLVAGSMMDKASIREEDGDAEGDDGADGESKAGEIDSAAPKIIQETVLQFGFDASLPVLRARELALDWTKGAFGTTADEDITGVSIWSASLILSRWIIDHAAEFEGKRVCELGSGCGVSGIASFVYTKAARVVLSDLFDHTLRNLEHNAALNRPSRESEATGQEAKAAAGCAQCGVAQRFTADNPEGKLMQCGGCRVAVYCSRECQKKAWKAHKAACKELRAQATATTPAPRCSLEVAAIDWAKPETWPRSNSSSSSEHDTFDVLLGSDLVYHEEIVPVLVNVVDGLLAPRGGKFVHVASQARHSLVEFKDAMAARGFACAVEVVPDVYKANPLVGDDAAVELFGLHFNEMSDIYCTYTFERRPL
ncbi:hypothetical protein PybrP1_009718 [[Pythium] brassicae (nom. inval.)]|nr:hypothetical protein PybrP1_009718 [[Pythium] brassicae (nom. inval.)]